MALNTSKCNRVTPLLFKGLSNATAGILFFESRTEKVVKLIFFYNYGQNAFSLIFY